MAASVGQKRSVAVKIYEEIKEKIEAERASYFNSAAYVQDLERFMHTDPMLLFKAEYIATLASLPPEILSIKVNIPEHLQQKSRYSWSTTIELDRNDDLYEIAKDSILRVLDFQHTYIMPSTVDEVYYKMEYFSITSTNLLEIEHQVKEQYRNAEIPRICFKQS